MPANTRRPRPAIRLRVACVLPWMLLAAWLAIAAPAAMAQPVITTPAPVASANSPPVRQRPSPEAVRDSATAPGSLWPERAALPQLTVPMGTPPVAPVASAPGVLPPNPAASAGGISDAVARCEAKTSTLERRNCRRQLAQQATVAR